MNQPTEQPQEQEQQGEQPAWARLTCPFISTVHLLLVQGPRIEGLNIAPEPKAYNAFVACLGPNCAIFHSCQPGGVQAAPGGEGE